MMSLEGLNSAQLKEHYAMCIQLCSTNKINSKNAFGLHVIDYMNQLTKNQKDGNLNFKLVSSTLDVGTKIYSNRVDSVSTQAQKVASNLHHALDDKNKDKDLADGENEDEEQDDQQNKKKAKQRQHKKNKTIGTKDSVTLTQLEYTGEQDQLFLKLSSTVDVGAANSYLIETLDIDSTYTFRIDSNEPYYQQKLFEQKEEELKEELKEEIKEDTTFTDFSEFYDKFNDLIKNEGLRICPRLDSFSFNNLNDEFDYGQNSAYAFRNLSVQDDNLLFNEDLDVNENLGDEIYDQFDGSGGNEFGLGQNDYTLAHKSIINNDNAQFMFGIIDALSDNPTDYCLFDNKIKMTWAGHEYWKPNPVYRMKMNQLAQQNKATEHTEKAKKAKKVFAELNFDNYEEEKIAEKSDIKLKYSTLENWQKNRKILLPQDFKREPGDFVLRFSKEQYNLFRKRKTANQNDSQVEYSNVFDNDFNELNQNDDQNSELGGTEFNLDEIFDLGTQETEQHHGTQSSQMPFIGDNLVDQPQMIPTINLPYTKFAKKIDVKRLKCAIWDLIKTNEDEFKEFNETKKSILAKGDSRMDIDEDTDEDKDVNFCVSYLLY